MHRWIGLEVSRGPSMLAHDGLSRQLVSLGCLHIRASKKFPCSIETDCWNLVCEQTERNWLSFVPVSPLLFLVRSELPKEPAVGGT